MERLYPINLALAGQPVLVVGAGRVAGRKVRDLLAAGAQVRIVAPKLSSSVARLARRVTICRRPFRGTDLTGVFLVVAATADEALQLRLAKLAKRKRLLVNVVDRPELCTFQMPARLRRGRLLLTISTAGAAPVFSRFLRRRLQRELAAWAPFGRFLEKARRLLKRRVQDGPRRQRLLRRLSREDLALAFRRRRQSVIRSELRRLLGEALARELSGR